MIGHTLRIYNRYYHIWEATDGYWRIERGNVISAQIFNTPIDAEQTVIQDLTNEGVDLNTVKITVHR